MILSFRLVPTQRERTLPLLELIIKFHYIRYGASIFVSAVPLVESFQQLLYNPQCFLVLESDTVLPPSQWSKVHFKSCA